MASELFKNSDLGKADNVCFIKNGTILISVLKFGLSEKHTKFEKIFLMVWTFTK